MAGKSTEDEDAEEGAGDSMDKEEDVDATDPVRDRARNCASEVGGKVFAGLAEVCRDVEPTRRWTFVLM